MKKILIVDDMQSWRDFHKQRVEEIFYDECIVTLASCAREAYNKILEQAKKPYDIIITDLQMEEDFIPQYAGEWLIEQVLNLNGFYRTNIILCSASNNIKNIAQAFRVNFIPKQIAYNDFEMYKATVMHHNLNK